MSHGDMIGESWGLTGANRDTILDNLRSLTLAADSTGAVSESVDEVLVGAEAGNVTSVATKLAGLLGTEHVVGASLLDDG